jgi:hypothetical protein
MPPQAGGIGGPVVYEAAAKLHHIGGLEEVQVCSSVGATTREASVYPDLWGSRGEQTPNPSQKALA